MTSWIKHRGVLTLSLLAILALPGLVGASDAPAEGEGGGLSFMALKRYDLGIFTLIVFGLLSFLVVRFAWPKISEGLAKREADILAAKDDAVKAKHDAEAIRAQLQAEFAEAQDKIRAMMEEARRDAEVLRTQERTAGAKEAQAERERATREIETAKQQALQEIQQQAIQLASVMSSKAVRRTITAQDHENLLQESLNELKSIVRV